MSRSNFRNAQSAALFAAVLSTAIGAVPSRAGDPPQKRVLTLELAQAIAATAAAEARKNNAGGAIAIADDGGHLLCLLRLDGTFPAAAAIATNKARSAAVFRKPTRDFENAVKSGRLALLANPELLPLQGGVPISLGGQVVGAIGVAGAASAQQDDDIAASAAAAVPQ